MQVEPFANYKPAAGNFLNGYLWRGSYKRRPMFTDRHVCLVGVPKDEWRDDVIPMRGNPKMEALESQLALPLHTIKPIAFGESGGFEVVWFDNFSAVQKRYVDLILTAFPEAKFSQSEIATPFALSVAADPQDVRQMIEITSEKKRVGFVMPILNCVSPDILSRLQKLLKK